MTVIWHMTKFTTMGSIKIQSLQNNIDPMIILPQAEITTEKNQSYVPITHELKLKIPSIVIATEAI